MFNIRTYKNNKRLLLQSLTVPCLVWYREPLCTMRVTVDLLRLWPIYWRKGQTQPLKMTMAKTPSHGPFVQGRGNIALHPCKVHYSLLTIPDRYT